MMQQENTSWRELISNTMAEWGESFDDVESMTLSDDQLDAEFYDGFGVISGCSFTVWTKNRVYFPAQYDGAEWCDSVSRNPDGNATFHIGGG